MDSLKSDRRARFEGDTLPHLDALCGTALWLTRSRDQATNLVLQTMLQAYRNWPASGSPRDNKIRLFSVLVGVCSDFGHQQDKPYRMTPIQRDAAGNSGDRDLQTEMTLVRGVEPSQLTMPSDVVIKDAISRFDPRSRLAVILLLREQLSYSEIAIITGLPRDAVRTALGRLRSQLSYYMIKTSTADTDGSAADATDNWDNEGGALVHQSQG
ncbi:MAG: sigma-70 family RNA polymerase sigma factor [Candidatus Abyssobacteria bacterium SURF_17]|uniref:Sigma-70 family RNA polymerase sigma factor n=1 Tax=Candidatus Abyssobacteria bacterium SURF_17 TaxID=2093361 RepID=A0A419EYV9_9BACT|nr:MAG: sigma-70 family RNA polymerase sigma factor [Candidatus Abyssubacteria bacterium SURF_17]